jgi:hypothetical protein
MLIYRCPETKRMVRSPIETTDTTLQRMGSLQLSLWCEHCGISHAIAAKDASVVSELKYQSEFGRAVEVN